MAESVRIDKDEGGIDDVAISDVTMFRMERMNNGCFWICAYTKENTDGFRFWLNARGKITATQE